tara:strand:+ start:514 stop:951 length:438 start_codon:yes stop_codon:yes gene_type:complete
MDTITEPITEPIVVSKLNELDLNDIEMKKEASRQRSKEWRKQNKERNNKYKREYYQQNSERMKAYSSTYMKAYYELHPDRKLRHSDMCRDNKILLTDEEKELKRHQRDVKKYKKLNDSIKLKAESHQRNYEQALAKLNGVAIECV